MEKTKKRIKAKKRRDILHRGKENKVEEKREKRPTGNEASESQLRLNIGLMNN